MYRSGKGVVDDKRDSIIVSYLRKFLDVKDFDSRIGDRLSEQEFGIGTEGGTGLLFRSILVYEGNLYPEFSQRCTKKVEGSAVDVAGCNDVSSCLADVDACKEVGRLAG